MINAVSDIPENKVERTATQLLIEKQAPDTESSSIEPEEPASSQELSAAERATQPITSWVETRLQNSSLLQPSTYSRDRPEQPTGERTLREAILLAREQFSGSVLSAERVDEDGLNEFRIKILSELGILRMINIDAAIATPASISTEQDIE